MNNHTNWKTSVMSLSQEDSYSKVYRRHCSAKSSETRNLSLPLRTSLSVGEDECDAHLEDEARTKLDFLVKEAAHWIVQSL